MEVSNTYLHASLQTCDMSSVMDFSDVFILAAWNSLVLFILQLDSYNIADDSFWVTRLGKHIHDLSCEMSREPSYFQNKDIAFYQWRTYCVSACHCYTTYTAMLTISGPEFRDSWSGMSDCQFSLNLKKKHWVFLWDTAELLVLNDTKLHSEFHSDHNELFYIIWWVTFIVGPFPCRAPW